MSSDSNYFYAAESRLLPDSLNKALGDYPWHYVIKLRDGTTIAFSGAKWDEKNPDWIHLDFDGDQPVIGGTQRLERGLDVRISEIVWAADDGS